ncbi:MAG TPA: DUF1659 domain-containing protein [Clostridia bacterium]|nr:DUF1659 domain-containing protein [Clostridia bacterium]
MAVIVQPMEASLRLVVIEGTTGQGDPIYRVRTFNRVKPDADPQSVYEVGQHLAGLQAYPLSDIQMIVQNVLSES